MSAALVYLMNGGLPWNKQVWWSRRVSRLQSIEDSMQTYIQGDSHTDVHGVILSVLQRCIHVPIVDLSVSELEGHTSICNTGRIDLSRDVAG